MTPRVRKDVAALTDALAPSADPVRARAVQAYLKIDGEFLGVPVPAVRAAVKAWLGERRDLDHERLVAVAQGLYASAWYEHRLAATIVLAARHPLLRSTDLPWLEAMLRAAKTWAVVDELCLHTLAPLVEREPAAMKQIRRWSRDPDFWIRRSSLLVMIPALRRGEGDFEDFEARAVPMLGEKEFFVRKAIGWTLREVAKRRPALVVGFIERHGSAMSGVTMREARRALPGKS